VVRQHPERYEVVALSAGRNMTVLAEQVRAFKPQLVSVQDAASVDVLATQLEGACCEIVHGDAGATQVASHADANTVVSAMVGAVGLKPTYAAICAGKHVALANKETLVMAGECMTAAVKQHGATLLPIDSEHSAIFQCLSPRHPGRRAGVQSESQSGCRLVGRHDEISRIILTASGGPFRDRPAETFAQITKAEALKHPNWSMGAKITIDSASMMNKGLELIEAMWLFDFPPSQIDIVVHPQSMIHSMVEYCDGSIIAQLSIPDMRGPIAYALAYPDRITSGIPRVDFTTLSQLTFEIPDAQKFPALKLAREAASAGGTLPAVMNAANEIAVAAFLNDQILFVRIPEIVEKTMQQHDTRPCSSIEAAITADTWARATASSLL
jgi:1-deoxy-D-xylulose-5-phosphate reductoisomerase